MDETQKQRREVRELLLRVSSGNATEDQEARLCRLILDNTDARQHVVFIMHQIATLESGATSLSEFVSGGFSELEELAVLGALEKLKKASATSSAASRTTLSPLMHVQECRRSIHPLVTQVWAYMPLSVAMLIGVMGTILWNRYFAEEQVVSSSLSPSFASPLDASPSEEVVARLVSNTGDVWNASVGQRLKTGDRLHTQETITIQEGIAKIELVSGLTLNLEGPAMVSVDSDGMLVVQYGKVVAGLPWGAKSTAVKTTLGEVQLGEDDISGIGVFGSSLSVYVFRGDAFIGARKNTEDEPLLLSAGEGRTLSIGPSGKRSLYSSRPDKKTFASWRSIASDRLLVTDAYVASVRKSHPVGYWRFEKVVEGEVLNDVSDKHHGTLGGKARLVLQGDNHALEFGFGPGGGHLFVEDPFDELAGSDYAFEMWIKPNHFHRGIVAALVDRRTSTQEEERNAFLLETLSEQVNKSELEYSLRFLHRSPPSASAKEGTSCYSSRDYEPGKWQYLVAVKRDHKMLLYINGSLVASDEDDTTLVSGLNLVVGQLYSFEPVRPFVGQLDELAVYNHALTTDDIESRYEMLR